MVELPVARLQVGMFVCELDRPWSETPFILRGFEVQNDADIKSLEAYCSHVYVKKTEETVAYQLPAKPKTNVAKLHGLPRRTAGAQGLVHAEQLYKEGTQLARGFMVDVLLGRAIDIRSVESVVSGCVQSIQRSPEAMVWLSRLRSEQDYTFEHSFNVGLLAIAFGRHLCLAEDDLHKLGVAGMLHDIGKMRTPIEILNKEGKLTPEEHQIMRQHASNGHDILAAHKNIDRWALEVALTHHETLDGTGYPNNIKGKGITEFTKIVTICDVYDALTSERCYDAGKSTLDAFRVLYDGRGRRFDCNLVAMFIECMGLYPPGSIVELVNGHVGIVISKNERQRRAPKVLVVTDKEKNLASENVIDLSCVADNAKGRGYRIKTVRPNGVHGIRVENYVQRGIPFD